MNTIKLTVATPDGNMFDGEAAGLFVRGAEGDLAVLAGHVPFVTTVQPGTCRIEMEDATEKVGTCGGGILTVSKERVILMSGTFAWK